MPQTTAETAGGTADGCEDERPPEADAREAAVQQDGEAKCDEHLERVDDQAEQQRDADALPELAVGEEVRVVVEADEGGGVVDEAVVAQAADDRHRGGQQSQYDEGEQRGCQEVQDGPALRGGAAARGALPGP
ncbi:hypothetical protein ACFC0C_38245 [Streptomyces sp. NPDC056178]|uniref:hypothetical protein n=1 Tax=Streptomyces sp. NPDC056178 TaxID=3345735 RepID=UPI0035DECBCF